MTVKEAITLLNDLDPEAEIILGQPEAYVYARFEPTFVSTADVARKHALRYADLNVVVVLPGKQLKNWEYHW